jgi:hypothetical protein
VGETGNNFMTDQVDNEPVQFTDAQKEEVAKQIGEALARERQIHAIEDENKKAHYIQQLADLRGGVSVEASIAAGQARDARDAQDAAFIGQYFGSKSDAVKANALAKSSPETYQRYKIQARRLKLIA